MGDQRQDIHLHNNTDLQPNRPIMQTDPKNPEELVQFVNTVLQQMSDRFQMVSEQILSRIDEMGNRIDDLERSIGDLMSQNGTDDIEK